MVADGIKLVRYLGMFTFNLFKLIAFALTVNLFYSVNLLASDRCTAIISEATDEIRAQFSSAELDLLANIDLARSFSYKAIRENSSNPDFLSKLHRLKQAYIGIRTEKALQGDKLRDYSNEMVESLAGVFDIVDIKYKIKVQDGVKWLIFSRSGKSIVNKLVREAYRNTRTSIEFHPYRMHVEGFEGAYTGRRFWISLEALIRLNDDGEITHLLKNFDVEFHEYIHALHDYILSGLMKNSIYTMESIPKENSNVYRQGSYASYLSFSELPAHLYESVSLIKFYKKIISKFRDGIYGVETDIFNLNKIYANLYSMGVIEALSKDMILIAESTLELLDIVDIGSHITRRKYIYYNRGELRIIPSVINYFGNDILVLRIKTKIADLTIYNPEKSLVEKFKNGSSTEEFYDQVEKVIRAYMRDSLEAAKTGLAFIDRRKREHDKIKKYQQENDKDALIESLEIIVRESEKLRDNFDFEGIIEQLN